MAFKIVPDVPDGHFWETIPEQKARIESNKPIRAKFVEVTKKLKVPTRGISSWEAAQTVAERVTDAGVKSKVVEYESLDLLSGRA